MEGRYVSCAVSGSCYFAAITRRFAVTSGLVWNIDHIGVPNTGPQMVDAASRDSQR